MAQTRNSKAYGRDGICYTCGCTDPEDNRSPFMFCSNGYHAGDDAIIYWPGEDNEDQ